MQSKITTTTSISGVGITPGKKIFKVPGGEYSGRMLIVVKTSDSDIKFCYADPPYSSWSSLTELVGDSSTAAIDAVMDRDGNTYAVYCEMTTGYLVFVKLTFAGGVWSVGSKIYIYNAGFTTNPSITIDKDGVLLVSFAREVAGKFDIQVKSSSDGGQTWGSGSSDIGDTLRTGLSYGCPKIVTSNNDVFVIYSADWTDICLRSRLLSGGSWTNEFVIATEINMDGHFDAALLPEGLLGVAFDADKLHYREFDGSNWSAVTVLDNDEGFYPQLSFYNNVPVVVYQSSLTDDQVQIKYTHRSTGVFSPPTVLDNGSTVFDRVILYDASSASYADLSSAASSVTVADIFHPSSNVLVHNSGDTIFLGLDQKFRFIKMILSSAGAGGTLTYSYWDGANWKSITPESSLYHLDSPDKGLILWQDYDSIPDDWQKNQVNSNYYYWVKLEVNSSFSTPPVGTMISAISEITSISLRR